MRKSIGGWSRFVVSLLGSPIEVVRRMMKWPWKSGATFVWRDRLTGRTITSQAGSVYDKFSLAPNLYKQNGQPSDADRIHDEGWETGVWDSGEWLSFNDNNRNFRNILISEGHPSAVVGTYYWFVCREFMRKKWEDKHGHP